MVTLGILTLQPHIETAYFKKIAKNAPRFGIQVIRFHPKDWDPFTNTVTGAYLLENEGAWEYKQFPLPPFIYDRCYYSANIKTDPHFQIVKKLKDKSFFLSTGLPNKWLVHKAVSRSRSLRSYLPETGSLSSSGEAVAWLLTKKRAVFKPKHGSQGKGILFLQLNRNKVEIQMHRKGIQKFTTYSLSYFSSWLDKLLSRRQYMAQSFLSLSNENGKPFDLRILMQKNDKGQWQEAGRGLRIGRKGSFVSNLHNGGNSKNFTDWLSKQPESIKAKINDQLMHLIETLPSTLEANFGRLYEIGIDVGIDRHGKCWLLEANSKPGHQTIIQTDPSSANNIYESPLRYCLYLEKQLIRS